MMLYALKNEAEILRFRGVPRMRHAVLLLVVTILVMTSVGSADETVRKYQAFLQQQGYDPGPINGIVSSKTLAAIQRYQHKADAGDRIAQYHVGTLYARGIAVPRDLAEAARWYRRAAEQGLNEAQYQLGVMYTHGNGVPRDLVRAYAWYYVAVQGANENAKRQLLNIEERLPSHQRQQALELGKTLFAVCTTSPAQ
jgi:peptidoglycan hydrolase-like protein with peptidoglycan-binding domain